MGSRGIWPWAAEQLVRELHEGRGLVGIMRSTGPCAETVDSLAAALGEAPLPVGRILTDNAAPPGLVEIHAALRGHRLLVELDVLFWPDLHLDPLSLLHRLGADAAVIAVWPGSITGRRAVYSEPGRPDHFEAPIRDSLVLTPVRVTYPDEVPYELERIPA